MSDDRQSVLSNKASESTESATSLSRKLEVANEIIRDQKKQIEALKQELDKIHCVLNSINDWKDMMSYSKVIEYGVRGKKEAISAEILDESEITPLNVITVKEDIEFIFEAFSKNDFFNHVDSRIFKTLIQFMYEVEYDDKSVIMTEGENGDKLFLIKSGKLAVLKADNHIGDILPGTVFGELALIYNCPRTATIQTMEKSKLIVLDRNVFKHLMMKAQVKEKHNQIEFLKKLPLTANLSHTKLALIANCLEKECFTHGDKIVKQGDIGDTFYIISEGYAKVIQDDNFIRKLGPGEYFGEQALLETFERTATVICISDFLECCTLQKKNLTLLVKDLKLSANMTYVESPTSPTTHTCLSPCIPDGLIDATIDDLEVIATLGKGGFGRVELVQLKGTDNTFALKSVSKKYVVKSKQQVHMMQEKDILMSVNSPFIIKLYKTFKDNRMAYFLMEAALGGEMWTVLRNKQRFSNDTVKFCLASVILAFEYLHGLRIVYRDLKPENLMLDSNGYVILVDFGFSKKISKGQKTWTFCGTPEYVAPEVILNKGHDFAVDIWALGILTFELLTGTPPFVGRDPMQIYKQTFRGVSAMNFPKYINKKAIKFIESTCKVYPNERLGYGSTSFKDLKNCQWLQSFDWDKLQARTLKSMIPTIVKSPTDTRNFDKFSISRSTYEEEFSGWDKDF